MVHTSTLSEPIPLSVLLCADTATARRLGPMIRRLAIGLLDQAVAVRLFAEGDALEEMATGALEVIHHRRAPWPFARMELRRVIDALAERPPSIIHALSPSVATLAQTIAEELDAELVVQLSSEDDCRQAARSAVNVEGWIAGSNYLREIAVNQSRLPQHLVESIHPGVPVGTTIACFSDDDQVPTLLCTSAFELGCGVDRLLAALLALKDQGILPLLFLWGEGPLEGDLRRYVKHHHLSAQVTFARPIGDTLDAMSGADVLVFAEVRRGISMDILQAMGRGLAVVCPDQIGCDAIQPGKTTFAFDPASDQSLAEVLRGVITDRTGARAMAGRAMNHIRLEHTVSGMAEQVARLYHRLVSQHATIRLKE